METRVAGLVQLVDLLERHDGFVKVVEALNRGQSGAIDGAWGSSRVLATAALAKHVPQTLLVVLPRIMDVDDVALDLDSFLESSPEIFPAWETLPDEHSVHDVVFGGRLRILGRLQEADAPKVVVTSIPALLQPVPSRDELLRASRSLSKGTEIDLDELMAWLVERGFERVPTIELAGEFSMHGGILDIFPPDAVDPLRIEFFGDEVESIRRFDVATQRKLEELTEARLTVIAPPDPAQPLETSSLLDSLREGSWVLLTELHELRDEGRHYLDRLPDRRGMFGVEATFSRCTDFPSVTVAAIGADSTETSCRLQIESVERFTGPKTEMIDELTSMVGQKEEVLIVCHNNGERDRLRELFEHASSDLASRVSFCVGHLARGFRLVRERVLVLSDNELFQRQDLRRAGPTVKGRRRHDARAIDSFLDLNEGDLVVHLSHGIGRYRGMKLMHKDNQSEEHLILEFRDSIRVFVPTSMIHLVQKYVGAAQTTPQLSKLGGRTWDKQKQKVAEAVTDMAADMIQFQAKREEKIGFACPVDTPWMEEFEASFPFTETKDQAVAIVEAKNDLMQPRPMDRLICGDVGYGKTEVAMRAAFKCVDSGRQVAVLVPTTVLAEQHYRTFSDRMAEYPISIECLSRFKTKRQQQATLERMATGGVDIVIGTHRLVQKDVRFKNLGVLVIDEEQRFGVDAKEMLKRLRLEIDVLTLTATPIPRTLHMSLLGIRDISNLQTPPHDRQAIETKVCRFDVDLIRNAIVRELNRNGQVYFVHNRVKNIEDMAQTIQDIAPEATIGIVHGQMKETDLEREMLGFVTGKTDILVATTIIESGLDIQNANTMFIHQAEIYGLADMHQLRGRVGRHTHRAYCYLIPTADKVLTPTAAKRLRAIEEYTELGAGFKIAMRDLEIRGAGNILGTEQSGHISQVGYELYCQLLENAVRRLKNLPPRDQMHVAIDLPVAAFVPPTYVPPGRQKIEVYRKLSQVRTVEELAEVAEELRDRFGPAPLDVQRLLMVKELQVFARHWQIDDIHLEGSEYAVFSYRKPALIHALAERVGRRLRIVDTRQAYWILEANVDDDEDLLADLKDVLQP